MRTRAKDGTEVAVATTVLRAIGTLMITENDGSLEATLVRLVQRDGGIDLDDDQILYVIRDAFRHGHDAEHALDRLASLSDAGRADQTPPRPR